MKCSFSESAATLKRRLVDKTILEKLVKEYSDCLREWELMAFPEMLKLVERDGDLSEKQRSFVESAAERLGVAIRYENLVSSGKVRSRPDLPPLFTNLPKRPPGK